MIPINKNTKVYIIAPAALFSGGPTLLHQLAEKLLRNGINAAIVYLPLNHPNPLHPLYKDFEVNFSTNIIDEKENLIIVPETMTRYLYKFKKIKKAIWWLSIDNYFNTINNASLKMRFALSLGLINIFKLDPNEDIFHFAQSQYAYEFLQLKNLPNIYFLSDFLPEIFLKETNTIVAKEDIILYNPTKGREFTQKIIQQNNDLKWIPLKGLTPDQVKNLLLRAKLYIDFGEHPGRDRFPREAAICKCCIITGRLGSAKYDEDIPINEEFKFEDKISNIPLISEKIRSILSNYNNEALKFKRYVDFIIKNEEVFENEVKNIFVITNNK